MKLAAFIFLFGGLGSLARFSFGYLNPVSAGFPAGTLIANIAACFIAGFTAGMVVTRPNLSPEFKTGILAGFCGGFSTFSTFSLETVEMFKLQKTGLAFTYISVSIVACLAGTWLGYFAGEKLKS